MPSSWQLKPPAHLLLIHPPAAAVMKCEMLHSISSNKMQKLISELFMAAWLKHEVTQNPP